jgi:hypothetical protein
MYKFNIEKKGHDKLASYQEGPVHEKDKLLTATLTAPTVPNCHISGLIPFNSPLDASSSIAPI